MSSPTDLQAIVQETALGLLIKISVVPRASRTAVAGIHDGSLKIRLTKPPVDGAANEECCRFVAKLLGVPKANVALAHGAASRHKTLLVTGITCSDALGRLSEGMP